MIFLFSFFFIFIKLPYSLCNLVTRLIIFKYLFLYLQIMKAFFFILGCFMLYLTCLPCGDSEECNVKLSAQISAATNHQEHHHNAESCTPFCTCSCCAASVFFVSYTKTKINKAIFQSEKHPVYNVALNGEVYYAIWQPPKLS